MRFAIIFLGLLCVSTIMKSSYAGEPERILDPMMLSDSELDENPFIASNGTSTTIVVWEHTSGTLTVGDDAGNSDHKNETIFYKRSTDFGASWGPMLRLGTGGSPDNGDDLMPFLCTDKKGTWIAAWYSKQSLNGTIGTDRDILFSRSTDDGLTWSPTAALNRGAAGDSSDELAPALATDGAGTWVASWFMIGGFGGRSLQWARSNDNGLTWSIPVSFAQTGYYTSPRVCFLGNATWLISYFGASSSSTQFNVCATRSTDNAISFSSPTVLDTAATWDLTPNIATDANGKVMVCWMSSPSDVSGPNFQLKSVLSPNRGSSWGAAEIAAQLTSPSQIGFSGNFLEYVGNDEWYWMFMSNETPLADADIFFIHSQTGNTWSAPQVWNAAMQADTEGDSRGYNGQSFAWSTNNQFLGVYNSHSNRIGNGTDGDIFYSFLPSPSKVSHWELY
jgi:hypothetical protein